MEKISARAKRFKTGGTVSVSEVEAVYKSLGVPNHEDGRREFCLEIIKVWSESDLDEQELHSFFREYSPLSVELLPGSAQVAHVSWSTSINSARAMSKLSRPIGIPSVERVLKHIITMEEEEAVQVVQEKEVAADSMVHPEDLGVEIPAGGPWRLATQEAVDTGVMLLRFARSNERIRDSKTYSSGPRVGLLSRSKRNEILEEQEKARQREQENKTPVDKRNPWGSVAMKWAEEQRGGRPIMINGQFRKRDWDKPIEIDDDEEPEQVLQSRKKPSIKDRLNYSARIHIEGDDQFDASDEEVEWNSKMKRPRMGMVADLVEKSSAKSRLGDESALRRKIPVREDSEEDGFRASKFDARSRIMKTAGRRLKDIKREDVDEPADARSRISKSSGKSMNERFASFRSEEASKHGLHRTLGGRLIDSSKIGSRMKDEKDEYEEYDTSGFGSARNLVIKVTRSDSEDDMQTDSSARFKSKPIKMEKMEYERGDRKNSDRNREKNYSDRDRDVSDKGRRDRDYKQLTIKAEKEDGSKLRSKIAERLHDRSRNKDLQDRYSRKSDSNGNNSRSDRDRGKSSLSRDTRDKKLDGSKVVSKKKVASSDEESGSESESKSDSESSSSSQSSSSSSSGSEESNSADSSDSESDGGMSKGKKSSGSLGNKIRKRLNESKGSSSKPKKDSKKKSSKLMKESELLEDQKKAAELKDKLKNYLKKAREAKEQRKK